MSEHLRKSIEELNDKLQGQLTDVDETKKVINLLYKMLDEPEPYQIYGGPSKKAPISPEEREYLDDLTTQHLS